jgi:hydrogenase expression/formation protein HypE
VSTPQLVAVVPCEPADARLAAARSYPAGADSAIVGEVGESPAARVLRRSAFGGQWIVDKLVDEQLLRIC